MNLGARIQFFLGRGGVKRCCGQTSTRVGSLLCLPALVVFTVLAPPTNAETVYNLKSDFSIAANPNGAWAYVWNTLPITRSDSYPSVWREWGYRSSHDGSVMQWFATGAGWHDAQPDDIMIHTLSLSYGGGSTYVGVAWTSPQAGFISVSGRAWDGSFDPSRNANWSLEFNGRLIASRTGVQGLYRNDPGAQFASNRIAGESLNNLRVSPGDKLLFQTKTTSQWGQYMGLDITVTRSDVPQLAVVPTNQVVSPGSSVTFAINPPSQPFTNYQWRLDDVNILGATNAGYTIPSAGENDAGRYTVAVWDGNTTNVSTAAVLALVDVRLLAAVYLTGPVGAAYRIDAASKLTPTNWHTVTNLTLPSRSFLFVDYASATNRQQFYRAIPQ